MFKRSLTAAAIVGLLSLASQARAQTEKPDCHVLSIGIDNYVNGPLKGCLNDARNIAEQFTNQNGRLFGKVNSTVLLDEQATKLGIDRGIDQLKRAGKKGDFVVLFLSGHGGRANNNTAWHFVPQDFNGQANRQVSDRQLLTTADQLASQGKKVFVIIDACFAGQLRVNAKACLNKNHPDGGGVVLMVSSMPSQTSAALGQFSAFAQAVVEGLSGKADFDGDGYVTLREVRRFAYDRVHQLVRGGVQDGEIDYSMSITENLKLTHVAGLVPLAAKLPNAAPAVQNPNGAAPVPAANLAGSEWAGNENLAGFGQLTFRLKANQQAVMIDAQGTTNGKWAKQGNRIVITFGNGSTVYVGMLQGERIQGTARGSRGNTWDWTVERQEAAQDTAGN